MRSAKCAEHPRGADRALDAIRNRFGDALILFKGDDFLHTDLEAAASQGQDSIWRSWRTRVLPGVIARSGRIRWF
jgi:hypothetical protein